MRVRRRTVGLSDVALLKRLRKSRGWLQALCIEVFQEQGMAAKASADGCEVRAFDATTVSEPGRTSSLWRIHYSVRLPSLTYDFFKLTRTKGRQLHNATDSAVLRKYGRNDMPVSCEFLPDHKSEEASSSRRLWRYRWPEEIRDKVPGRLIEVNSRSARNEHPSEKARTAEPQPRPRSLRTPREDLQTDSHRSLASSLLFECDDQ